jgi:hypothetical protein
MVFGFCIGSSAKKDSAVWMRHLLSATTCTITWRWALWRIFHLALFLLYLILKIKSWKELASMRIINIIAGILGVVCAPVIIIMVGVVGILGTPIGLLYSMVKDRRGTFTTPWQTHHHATLAVRAR